MKIVRKSNAQATQSNITDDGHGPPLFTPTPLASQKEHDEHRSPGLKRADFSHMYWQELHDLINCQENSGQLSSEDSTTLRWLSTEIETVSDADEVDTDTNEPVNLMEYASSGLQNALSSGNHSAASQFERAMDLMQAIQGQTIGVDTIA